MRSCLAMMLTACSSPVMQVLHPPPLEVTLESTARGTPSIARLQDLPPTVSRVWILTGTHPASGPCAGSQCVGVESPTRWPAIVSAGAAEVEILLPDEDTLWIQAVARSQSQWQDLGVLEVQLTDAYLEDRDNDHLSDGQEVDLGTDLRERDTDQGGVWDGVEVNIGRDPLDSTDDPFEHCQPFTTRPLDLDQDGDAGCCDSDCENEPFCQQNCWGTADNDCDGSVGCYDSDCATSATCVEDCSTLDDRDGDGLPACADEDCIGECTEVCSVPGDQDGDGLDDCADPDCNLSCMEQCGSGVDDDGDGLVDCQDADCLNHPLCVEADCADAFDNDNDGLSDCDDEDCWGLPCTGTRVSRIQHGSFHARRSSELSEVNSYSLDRRRWGRNSWHGRDLVGTITTATALGTHQCQWTIDDLIVRYSTYERTSRSYYGYQWPTHDVAMVGISVSPGCATTPNLPLPENLLPEEGGHLRVGLVRGLVQPKVHDVKRHGGRSQRLRSLPSYNYHQPTLLSGFRRDLATTWTGELSKGLPVPLP